MKRLILLALISAATALIGLAQERSLTNDDVIGLVKAGISEDVIIAKIKANPANFDTSAENLRTLKDAGVPDKVTVAIVQFPKGSNSTIPNDEETLANEPKAVVYFYRMNGGAMHTSVFVDDKEVARTDGGAFFVVKLEPGQHTITVNEGKSGGAMELKAGHRYFFRSGIDMNSFWRPHGSLELVPRPTARLEIGKLKPLQAKWIKNPSMVAAEYPEP